MCGIAGIIYRDGSRDWAVMDAGVTYSWNWDNLKKLLETDQRLQLGG